MNQDFAALDNKDLARLYLNVRQELTRRKLSLQERRLKDLLNAQTASHNIGSTLPQLARTKARAVDRKTRTGLFKKTST